MDLPLRLGGHQICVEDQQAPEGKRQGLPEGRKLILGDTPIAHALGALREDALIGCPQMGLPAITVSVLRFHVVPLDGREMAAPLGRRLPRGGRAIAFISLDRSLRRTDMAQALGIWQIGGRGRHFVDQARLHIHTDMFLIPVPILLLALAPNPGLRISRHFRQHVIIECLDFLLSRLVPLFPQRGFRNQMGGIHQGAPCTHEPRGLQLVTHRRKQWGEPCWPHAGTDTGKQAIVGGGLGQGKPTEPFGRESLFQILLPFPIREVCHELE